MPEVATPKKSSGWTTVAFGDVVQLSKERSSDPEADGYERYIGLEHIDPGELRVRRWGDIADGVTFTNVFKPGQVLFGKRRAYQRKVAVADFSGVCSGDIYVLEPKGDALLPELLPFICQTDAFFEHAVGTSAGSLSPRTNWKSLATFEFALPPIEEQRQLVVLFGTVTSLQSALLDAEVRAHRCILAVMQRAFPKKHTRETTALGDVLVSIADYRGKTPPYTDSGIPVISAENVGGGRVKSVTKYVTEETYERWLTRSIPASGDTIITMEAPAAEVAEFPSDGRHLLTRRVIALQPDTDRILKRFLYWQIRWLSESGYFIQFAHGTTVPRLYKPDVLNSPIYVPPLPDQEAVCRELDELLGAESSIRSRRAESRRFMKALRHALLAEDA